MKVTALDIYKALKLIDEALSGLTVSKSDIIATVNVQRAKISECDRVLKESENELGITKASLERLETMSQLETYKTVEKNLSTATSILYSLKALISSVNKLDSGIIELPDELFTFFVKEGISEYGSYDFERRIAEKVVCVEKVGQEMTEMN